MNLFPENISLSEAAKMQIDLAQEVILRDEIPLDLKIVSGVAIHSRGNSVAVSFISLKSEDLFKSYEIFDEEIYEGKAKFPAVPTFEGFREGKVIYELLKKKIIDILFIDGHGIDHPRKFGLACHVAIALNLPTIAVSKSLIAGEIKRIENKEFIVLNGEIVGEVLQIDKFKFFISPAHKITLERAIEITKMLTKSYEPEPLFLARKKLIKKINQIKENI